MNNLSKKYKNEEGQEETIILSSTDNYDIDLTKKYKLANHVQKKQSKLVEKFKGSLLGSDIGVKSSGFTNVAVLATVIAIAAIAIMYFMWRF